MTEWRDSRRGLKALSDSAESMPGLLSKPRRLKDKLNGLRSSTARPVDQAAVFLNKLSDRMDQYARHKLRDPVKPRGPQRLSTKLGKMVPEQPIEQTWEERAELLGRKAARVAVQYASRGLRAFVDWMLR